MKISYSIALTALLLGPLSNTAIAGVSISCSGVAAPVISKADLNGDGVVDGKDVALISKHIAKKNSLYSPLYDRDYDGVIDTSDKLMVKFDRGLTTEPEEQALAKSCKEIEANVFTGW